MIIGKIQESTGKPADIRKISLGWHNGIALDVQGLVIYEDSGAKREWVRFESAAVKADARALLRKELQASSIILKKPEFSLSKKASGPVDGAQPAGPSQVEASSETQGAAALPFFVDVLKIEDGRFQYIDLNPRAPLDLEIREIDASAENFSVGRPSSVKAEMAFLSGSQNLNVKGGVSVDPSLTEISIGGLEASLDISAVDAGALLKTFPSLQSVGVAQGLKGQAKVNVPSLIIKDGKLQGLQGDLEVRNGWIKLGTFALPVEGLSVDAKADLTRSVVQLEGVSAKIGPGTIAVSGFLNNFQRPDADLELQGSIAGLDLKQLTPPADPEKPYLEGQASVTFRMTARGSAAPVILQTLTGNAQVYLKQGVLRNMNVLREVFSKLSVIPGVSQSLDQNLPVQYKEKLRERDTYFEPIEIPVQVQGGNVFWNNALVRGELFELALTGGSNFQGMGQIQAVMTLDQGLSEAMVLSLPRLQILALRDGRLQLPLNLVMESWKISVSPSQPQLLNKLASGVTQEVLGNILNRNNPQQQAGTQQGGYSGSYPQDPYQEQQNQPSPFGSKGVKGIKGKDILAQLLQNSMSSQDSGSGSGNNSGY